MRLFASLYYDQNDIKRTWKVLRKNEHVNKTFLRLAGEVRKRSDRKNEDAERKRASKARFAKSTSSVRKKNTMHSNMETAFLFWEN